MTKPHEILGLPRNATADEVKQRYRELASKAHPDKGGTVEQFQTLRAAYEAALELPPVKCETCEDTGTVMRPVTTKRKARGLVGDFAVKVPCPSCKSVGR
jgi:DnaJ-class molecular chaperone